eukprot:816229_1
MSQAIDSVEKKEEKKRYRYFMFVQYPKANGPKQILNLLHKADYDVDCAYDINQLKANYHDALIIPGGTARVQQNALGENGINKILSFVGNGGGYIGFCAGAFLGSYQTKLKNGALGMKLLNCEFYTGNVINKIKFQGEIHFTANSIRLRESSRIT